jgi:RNA polymerase sigma factor (sigma-70 family)
LPQEITFLPGIDYNGTPELAPLWDRFTRDYAQNGSSQYNIRNISFLNQLVFVKNVSFLNQPVFASGEPGASGLGVEQFMAQHRLGSNQALYKDTKERIEDISKAVAELANNETTRPLNREIIHLLISQWIELERKHGLYPPPSISRNEGVLQDRIDETLAKRRALLKTPEGGLIAGALRMTLDNTIRSQTHGVYHQLKKRKEYHDVLVAAYDVFEASLFSYEFGHNATFPTYVQSGLMRNLKNVVLRRSDDDIQSLDADKDGDDRPLKELLKDTREGVPVDNAIRGDLRARIRAVVDKLHPRYKEILYLRYGLEDGIDRSLEDVGRELGISRARVGQLEAKAIPKLLAAYQATYGESLSDFFKENYQPAPPRPQQPKPKRPVTHELTPHDLNPGGKKKCLSFGEMVELAADTELSFDRFLDQLLTEEWKIKPQEFHDCVVRNMNERLKQARLQDGFDEDSLPEAVRQYLQRKGSADSYRHEFAHEDSIQSWQEGAYNPRGNYIAQMAYAFALTPRQENLLWKITYGKPLRAERLQEALDANHSGELAALLIGASGIMQRRLCEMLDVNPSTQSGWMSHENPSHIGDVEVADKFANLILQSLQWNNQLQALPENTGLKQRIMNVMTGRRLDHLPASPEDAAGKFTALFDESFRKGHSFNAFLKEVIKAWDVPAAYLNFLNANNAEHIVDYQPVNKGTLCEWVSNPEASLRSSAVEKVIAGSFMTEEQELKLWKMMHGRRVTAEEVRAAAAEGNSGKLLTLLYQGSGIGRNRLMHLLSAHDAQAGGGKPQISEHHNPSMLSTWLDQDNPAKIRKVAAAERLADVLLPHIGWPEQEPLAQKEMETLHAQVVEQLTGRNRTQSLHSLVLEARTDAKPHGRLCQKLVHRCGIINDEVAKKIGLTPKMLTHCKSGNNVLKESEAIQLIALAGGGDATEVTDAVSTLTRTRSPAELLADMEAGRITAGDVLAETRTRRKVPQKDMKMLAGVDRLKIIAFEKGAAIDAASAQRIAEFIGFAGTDKDKFVAHAGEARPANGPGGFVAQEEWRQMGGPGQIIGGG